MRRRCKPRPGTSLRQHYVIRCEHCGPVCVHCGERPARVTNDIPSGTCPACTQELVNLNGKPVPGLDEALLPGLRAILERNGKGSILRGRGRHQKQVNGLAHLQEQLGLGLRQFAKVLGITHCQLLRYKNGQELRPSTIRRIIGRLERKDTAPR